MSTLKHDCTWLGKIQSKRLVVSEIKIHKFTNSEITDDGKYLSYHRVVSTRGVQTVHFPECDVPR